MSFAYLPWYTGDYLRDTRHLSPLRHGVYLLLLAHCWDQKGPVPLDEQEAAGIANCRSVDEIDALRYVIGRFFTRMEDGHYNKRMTEEVARAESQSQAYREAGLKSASVRREKARAASAKGKLNQGSTKVQPRSVSPSPSPSPSLTLSPEKTQQPTVAPAQPAAKRPDCPHLLILESWKSMLPSMPAHEPDYWKGARATHLKARWRETADLKDWHTTEDGVAYFEKLFRYIGKSRFLTGKTEPSKGKPAFQAELEWVVSPGNWAKIHEGKYHAE